MQSSATHLHNLQVLRLRDSGAEADVVGGRSVVCGARGSPGQSGDARGVDRSAGRSLHPLQCSQSLLRTGSGHTEHNNYVRTSYDSGTQRLRRDCG